MTRLRIDERSRNLLIIVGLLVTFVASVAYFGFRFTDQSRAMRHQDVELERASRERATLSRKLDEAVATNAELRAQVADLNNQLTQLRAQIPAGVQPMTAPPATQPAPAAPARSGATPVVPPVSQPPPATQPPRPQPTLCVLGVCVP